MAGSSGAGAQSARARPLGKPIEGSNDKFGLISRTFGEMTGLHHVHPELPPLPQGAASATVSTPGDSEILRQEFSEERQGHLRHSQAPHLDSRGTALGAREKQIEAVPKGDRSHIPFFKHFQEGLPGFSNRPSVTPLSHHGKGSSPDGSPSINSQLSDSQQSGEDGNFVGKFMCDVSRSTSHVLSGLVSIGRVEGKGLGLESKRVLGSQMDGKSSNLTAPEMNSSVEVGSPGQLSGDRQRLQGCRQPGGAGAKHPVVGEALNRLALRPGRLLARLAGDPVTDVAIHAMPTSAAPSASSTEATSTEQRLEPSQPGNLLGHISRIGDSIGGALSDGRASQHPGPLGAKEGSKRVTGDSLTGTPVASSGDPGNATANPAAAISPRGSKSNVVEERATPRAAMGFFTRRLGQGGGGAQGGGAGSPGGDVPALPRKATADGGDNPTSPTLGASGVPPGLPQIRTKDPPPGAQNLQVVTSGVLKSIDLLYSAGVAKPVGTLIGPGVERLHATLQQVSLKELMDGMQRMAQARREGQGRRPVYPNKQRLSSVQDFFLYAEAEGRKLFDELDFDGDGQVNLQDLEHAMRRRRLPKQYARDMLRRVRRHWLAKSFGWKEFQMLMEQKEPSMLRAFTSLSVSSSGTLQKEQVLASLQRAGLPATDSTAKAMMKFFDADGDRGHVTYGQFRNFLLLLPPERLSSADPSMLWFEAATVVPMAPPVATAGSSVLRSALAGGLASGLSTCMMHPLDTIKTLVQASSATLPEVLSSVPKMGVRGLYRGATPAILGQFASHGLRTGMFEATRMLLMRLNPHLNDYQVQPVASFCSTVLGTAIRIPCEVLKQRLQAGMYDTVPQALSCTLQEDGVRGLFRGTTATLLREVPFYVFGMLIYMQVKKATKNILRRELAPWETILLGGVSGGLAAVAITPFDVIKTRMMIAPKGSPSGLLTVGMNIAASEGVGALYKGALPRFFWIAPLGAMNFAGYELAKQAMEEGQAVEGAIAK